MKKVIGFIFGLIFMANCLAKVELYILVSFSMSEDAIVALSHSGKKVNADLYTRGLVGDDFLPHGAAVRKIVKQTDWGIGVEPRNFTKFNVDAVPCFILADVDLTDGVKAFDKITGNITLEYALEQFSEKGELSSDARILLNKLRGSRDQIID